MRISDWSSDVCSSDLDARAAGLRSPSKPYRVGLIGTGWYGKSDLFRLIQVSPVNVVALCDADQQMLAGAGKMVSQRQQSGKVPQLYSDYRKMLTENKLDIVLIGTPDHWHADRKSVVLGKSVSVSVAFGGRRTIKKKK